ncbi:hypothetical protein ACE38W_05390 [Chitinophaga sp. Hz27]|uniref:hypothetical protein n=1 Tax=Chitinophaga sp. Hz27 TaxID=3347169 RepID=UPI0035E083A6
MKRAIIFIAVLMCAIAGKAQLPYYGGMEPYTPSILRHTAPVADSNGHAKKWSVTKYTGISTGFIAFKGGSGSYLSAPMALQVNRRITDNVYAFGSLSATPYTMRMSGAMFQPVMNKQMMGYGPMQMNSTGINPAANVGLMFISKDKTFSISGSVSVSRSNYYGYSPYGPFNSF